MNYLPLPVRIATMWLFRIAVYIFVFELYTRIILPHPTNGYLISFWVFIAIMLFFRTLFEFVEIKFHATNKPEDISND
jgi:hypothetical protein